MASVPRPVLVVLGAVVLAGAFFLAKSIVAGDGSEPRTGTGANLVEGASGADAAEAPSWEDFLVAAEQADVPRPVLTHEKPPVSPFDRGLARMRLIELNLRLEGIGRGGEGGGIALISGDRLRVGDSLDVFRVVSIRPAAVSLEGPTGVRIDLVPRPPDEEEEEETSPSAEVSIEEWEKEDARRAEEALRRRDRRDEKPIEARDRDDVR